MNTLLALAAACLGIAVAAAMVLDITAMMRDTKRFRREVIGGNTAQVFTQEPLCCPYVEVRPDYLENLTVAEAELFTNLLDGYEREHFRPTRTRTGKLYTPTRAIRDAIKRLEQWS